MITGWEDFARDLGQLYGEGFLADFCRSILDEEKAKQEVVYGSQQRIAAASAKLDNCWVDGLGELHMRLDPAVYFYWTQRYGPQIWNDKDFVRKLKRDNPSIALRARSRKTMVRRPT
jgi:hypothetical protein